VGRFVIWTESAFKQLDSIFGSKKEPSKVKKNFRPPRAVLTNCDVARIINSHEVQSKLNDKKRIKRSYKHKNPLTNFKRMARLNPHAVTKKRLAILEQRRLAKRTKEEKARDNKLKISREVAREKKLPRLEFKKQLRSTAVAPPRSAIEVGVLVGTK